MKKCEFCEELSASRATTFSSIYGTVLKKRTLWETEDFVVLPTIGQLVFGSLLVIPKRHVDSCALLEEGEKKDFAQILDEVFEWASQYGSPVFFEHGAKETTGGSCGIYHAHLHVVPLPREISLEVLFPEHDQVFGTLTLALNEYRFSNQYLLIGDKKKVLSTEFGTFDARFPSQFFRRRILEKLKISRNWNWRDYKEIESDLVKTVQEFEAQRAPSG